MTTAVTPWSGMPFRPATWTATVLSGPTGAFGAPIAYRVSSTRTGVSGLNVPAVVAGMLRPSATYLRSASPPTVPPWSSVTWIRPCSSADLTVEPAENKKSMWPSVEVRNPSYSTGIRSKLGTFSVIEPSALMVHGDASIMSTLAALLTEARTTISRDSCWAV